MSHRRARVLALITLGLVGAAASGLPRLEVDASNEAYYVEGDPTLARYADLRRIFGSDEVVYVLVESPGAFGDGATLEALVDLGRRLRALPRVVELRSALHAPIPVVDAGGALASVVVERAPRATAEDRARLRAQVLGHAPLRGLLVDDAARAVGFLLRLDGAARATAERAAFSDALDAVLEAGPWAAWPHAAVGTPLHATLFARLLAREVRRAVVVGLVAGAACLWLLFGAWRAVVAPLACAAATLAATLGLLGHAGVPVSPVTSILASVLVVASVADSMHLVAGHERELRRGAAPLDAWRTALAEAWAPCLVTSLTTAAGLLAVLGSGLRPLRDLGAAGAVGVVVAYGVMLGLLPALLLPWRPGAGGRGAAWAPVVDRWLAALLLRVGRRPRAVAALSLAALGLLCAGVGRLRVDHDFLAYLDPDEPLRRRLELVQARMGGAVAAEVVVDTGREGGARTAAALQALEGLEAWLRGLDPRVRAVQGVADGVAEVHALFDGPRAVPATDDAADQLLLVLESLDADLVRAQLSLDGRWARVTVRLDVVGSAVYDRVLGAIEAELPRRLAGVGEGHLTGGAVLLARMKAHVLRTQLQGLAGATALVLVVLVLVARDLRLGLLALVPNAAPVFAVLGVMGWAGIALEVSNVLVATLALGIVVDDTVHLVHALRAARARGADPAAALAHAFEGAGRAVVFTTLVLAAVFGAHLGAALSNLRAFGLLSVVTFAVALAAELVLLPALVLAFPWGPPRAGPPRSAPG